MFDRNIFALAGKICCNAIRSACSEREKSRNLFSLSDWVKTFMLLWDQCSWVKFWYILKSIACSALQHSKSAEEELACMTPRYSCSWVQTFVSNSQISGSLLGYWSTYRRIVEKENRLVLNTFTFLHPLLMTMLALVTLLVFLLMLKLLVLLILLTRITLWLVHNCSSQP